MWTQECGQLDAALAAESTRRVSLKQNADAGCTHHTAEQKINNEKHFIQF